MRTRMISAAAALLMGLLTACGASTSGGSGSSAATPTVTPTASSSSSGGGKVSQNLTLSGDLVAGTMTEATVYNGLDGMRNGEYINMDFKGSVGGKNTDIDLEIRQPGNGNPGFHGPGTYDVAGLGDGKGHASVTLDDNTGVDTDPNSGGGTGTITINGDLKAGSVDIQFSTNNETLKGDWHLS